MEIFYFTFSATIPETQHSSSTVIYSPPASPLPDDQLHHDDKTPSLNSFTSCSTDPDKTGIILDLESLKVSDATVELSVEKPNESVVSAAGCSLSSDPDVSLQIIVNESMQHPVHNTPGYRARSTIVIAEPHFP